MSWILDCPAGVDFQVKTIRVDDRNIAIQLWDTAGMGHLFNIHIYMLHFLIPSFGNFYSLAFNFLQVKRDSEVSLRLTSEEPTG